MNSFMLTRQGKTSVEKLNFESLDTSRICKYQFDSKHNFTVVELG